MNRRRFCRSGLLFVPALFAIGQARGQSGFLGQTTNGLLNGLLAYWKLDDAGGSGTTWTDSTGNGWGAVQTGSGISTSPSGIINSCANHGAVDTSFLRVSDSFDTRANTTPLTISVWFNFNAGTVLSIGNAIFEYFFSLQASSTGSIGVKPRWITTDHSSVQTTITWGTGFDNVNIWHHLVIGYDGTNSFMVVDNGARLTAAVVDVKRLGLFICNNSSTNGNWSGRTDEMGYWTRALSASDISMLFNDGHALPFSSFTS